MPAESIDLFYEGIKISIKLRVLNTKE